MKRFVLTLLVWGAALGVWLLPFQTAWALEVVVSIKPLHALVAAVMGSEGKPALLIQGNVSEHTYALRPSDARLLSRAEVVFWGGPTLEGFLVRPLENLSARAVKVSMLEAEGVRHLPARAGGAWEEESEHDHDHGKESAGHDHEHHGPEDPHVWLDPRNALAMVQVVARALAGRDPAGAERYQANAAALTQRLEALDKAIEKDLIPVRKRPYIVFHDAYQYFEHRYGLGAVGSVMVHPERPPGARRVHEIGQRIRETGAVCLFTEPQYPQRLAESVAAGQPVRLGVLDPLGAAIPEGPELYFELLRGLSRALLGCLGSGTS
ncbi:MAG: zinc ABC transporter substrate-binding protein [Magnetococcales bacterium]|nr:zinc ABC transporter substrate-binding protein [Magnetococcales bacterium]